MLFPFFCIGFLFLTGCNINDGADVKILKTQYPTVHYQGPKQEADIKFRKTKPDEWTDLKNVSKTAVGAIIVSEDWAFYSHKGYDPNQIREAIRKDMEEGKFARGASTITQQVARNVFLNQKKTLLRKARELVLAVKMEEVLTKSKILEIYLNIAEWGDGIYGISKASFFYFNKPPSELTAKEGAFLAMLLPSPKRYNKSFKVKHLTEYGRKTINSILNKMTQANYLTDEERDRELEAPLSFEAKPVLEITQTQL